MLHVKEMTVLGSYTKTSSWMADSRLLYMVYYIVHRALLLVYVSVDAIYLCILELLYPDIYSMHPYRQIADGVVLLMYDPVEMLSLSIVALPHLHYSIIA